MKSHESQKNNYMNFFQKHYILVPILVVILSVLFLIKYFHYHDPACLLNYKYINQDVICGDKAVIKKIGYAETQDKLAQFIETEKNEGRVKEVSVYFRDLKSGPIFGINENNSFAPASLLKLPLSLVFFNLAESNPSILQEKMSYNTPLSTFGQAFVLSDTIKPNVKYTIEQLLESMLKHSDNNAYLLLFEYLEKTNQEHLVRQTYLELGILSPNDAYDEIISVRRYASILRALYNISYISPKYSEKILDWLSETEFNVGLENGNIGNVKISHKFGERFAEDGSKQLHDCGIVYYPENPYLLCIMTKGKDFSELSFIISYIAKEVYKEVDSRRIK